MTGAGSLRDRVTLEKVAKEPSGGSGSSVAYDPVDEVWAEVRSVRYSQFAEQVQVREGATHTIRLRWRRTDDFDFVSAEGQRRWKVLGVREPDNRRRWVDLFCEEVAAEVAS
jgi:head-tail adaptor